MDARRKNSYRKAKSVAVYQKQYQLYELETTVAAAGSSYQSELPFRLVCPMDDDNMTGRLFMDV